MPETQAGSHDEVTASVWFQPTFLKYAYVDPRSCREERQRVQAEDRGVYDGFMRQLESDGCRVGEVISQFNDRFGASRRVRAAREAKKKERCGSWSGWYDARLMIATALGAPEPKWINGSWWHDRDCPALEWVDSVEDVMQIPVPDWQRVPQFQKMLDSRDLWQKEYPEEPPSGFGITLDLTVPGRGLAQFVNYPSFVDLGIVFLGMTRFLTVLGSDAALARALMDLIFELTTGYTEFLLELKPERIEALCGFGGDATCLLSPQLYETYGLGWDARLFDFVRKTHQTPDDLPCNLHSCGPSGHLYDAWGRHPCQRNLTTLQTRLLPGEVKRLRDSLPNTQLELTLHPPHFDVVQADPSETRDVLRQSAKDAGFRNVHFTIAAVVHRPEDMGRVVTNLTACHETMEEIAMYGE
ncbi:MAG: hypothetical protein HY318_10400 [Armatimonadetes bacterium]|nr:hypothetical protein [Armatimonadota bacterium]